MTTSILDEVVGLGPKRKKKLLKEAGNFTRLKSMSLAEIKALGVLPDVVAEDLFELLRHYNEETDKSSEGIESHE